MTGKAKKTDIMDTAARLLEHRMRTEQEVRRRLEEAAFEEEEIRSCLDRLKELHYIDDRAYALTYLRRSLEKRRGRCRIFRELRERGIERNIVQQAIYDFEDEEGTDLSEEEFRNAAAEAARLLEGSASTEKERARAGRRLAALGYETSLIYAVLGQIGQDTL